MSLTFKDLLPATQTPIILGRPFLATCNAQINCRSGQLEITFGNMKLEQNIFSACNVPSLEDDVEDVCVIDSLVQEHVDSFCEDRFEPEFQ